MINDEPIGSISFHQTETHVKAWGEEIWIKNFEKYCGKILRFNKGASLSDHYHILKEESWFILSGFLVLYYYDLKAGKRQSKNLTKGDVIHIPAGNPHQLEAVTDAEIVEVSSQHFSSDSYRLSPSQSIIS